MRPFEYLIRALFGTVEHPADCPGQVDVADLMHRLQRVWPIGFFEGRGIAWVFRIMVGIHRIGQGVFTWVHRLVAVDEKPVADLEEMPGDRQVLSA